MAAGTRGAKFGGTLGFAGVGSGETMGHAKITASFQLKADELEEHFAEHHVNRDTIPDEMRGKQLHAWVLQRLGAGELPRFGARGHEGTRSLCQLDIFAACSALETLMCRLVGAPVEVETECALVPTTGTGVKRAFRLPSPFHPKLRNAKRLGGQDACKSCLV